MSQTDANTITVTVGPSVAERDIDEIFRALDEADIDAVIAPFPRRMGLPVEPLALAIEIPLGVLGAAILSAAGRKAWMVVTRVIERHRSKSFPVMDSDRVMMTIYDAQRRIRLDITADALTDDRLWASLPGLTDISDTRPVSLRWDRSSADWRVMPADELPQ